MKEWYRERVEEIKAAVEAINAGRPEGEKLRMEYLHYAGFERTDPYYAEWVAVVPKMVPYREGLEKDTICLDDDESIAPKLKAAVNYADRIADDFSAKGPDGSAKDDVDFMKELADL